MKQVTWWQHNKNTDENGWDWLSFWCTVSILWLAGRYNYLSHNAFVAQCNALSTHREETASKWGRRCVRKWTLKVECTWNRYLCTSTKFFLRAQSCPLRTQQWGPIKSQKLLLFTVNSKLCTALFFEHFFFFFFFFQNYFSLNHLT